MEDLGSTTTDAKNMDITVVAKIMELNDIIILTSMFSLSLLPFDSQPLTTLILHLIHFKKKNTVDCN